VGALLLEGEGHATALVSLTGLRDVAAVERAARAHGARLLDMKQASESLVADYRARILAALALAALALSATVWFALRALRRVLRVRSEEHTSELQSRENIVCRRLLEKKKYES